MENINKFLLLSTAFSLGYIFNDVTDIDLAIIPKLNADVAGMDQTELRQDYAFKKAVRKVVERYCTVDYENINC
jgi:hypothetical protein